MSKKGRELDPKKIAVIDELATPINANGIAKLLGHVGWYTELIPDYTKMAVPITQLLKKIVNLSGQRHAKGHLRS